MRYFTLDQAQRLIPEVERHVRDALFHKAEMQQASEEMERTFDRVRVSGGARLDPTHQRELRTRRETSVKALQKALGLIEETGAVVKDLDIGLLDFPCRVSGEIILLCWKLGEKGITHWHGTDEGFAGRKPIDETIARAGKKKT